MNDEEKRTLHRGVSTIHAAASEEDFKTQVDSLVFESLEKISELKKKYYTMGFEEGLQAFKAGLEQSAAQRTQDNPALEQRLTQLEEQIMAHAREMAAQQDRLTQAMYKMAERPTGDALTDKMHELTQAIDARLAHIEEMERRTAQRTDELPAQISRLREAYARMDERVRELEATPRIARPPRPTLKIKRARAKKPVRRVRKTKRRKARVRPAAVLTVRARTIRKLKRPKRRLSEVQRKARARLRLKLAASRMAKRAVKAKRRIKLDAAALSREAKRRAKAKRKLKPARAKAKAKRNKPIRKARKRSAPKRVQKTKVVVKPAPPKPAPEPKPQAVVSVTAPQGARVEVTQPSS